MNELERTILSVTRNGDDIDAAVARAILRQSDIERKYAQVRELTSRRVDIEGQIAQLKRELYDLELQQVRA